MNLKLQNIFEVAQRAHTRFRIYCLEIRVGILKDNIRVYDTNPDYQGPGCDDLHADTVKRIRKNNERMQILQRRLMTEELKNPFTLEA